jgi:hypothetical protein
VQGFVGGDVRGRECALINRVDVHTKDDNRFMIHDEGLQKPCVLGEGHGNPTPASLDRILNS